MKNADEILKSLREDMGQRRDAAFVNARDASSHYDFEAKQFHNGEGDAYDSVIAEIDKLLAAHGKEECTSPSSTP